jgi:single-stranded-DNA-specific exonuclease
LVAARLAERFFRPAVVGTWVDGAVRASCRSIAGFHITKALDQCADILVRHGGHEIAAGFTVREEHLGQLRERLTKIAWQELSGRDLRPGLYIDQEVTLTELQPQLLDYLEMLQPTGQGNPEPVFCSRNLKITQARAVGSDKGTLKLTVTDGNIFFDAIAFRMGHLVDTLPKKIDLAYQFETNVFNGRTTLQLQVKDLKASGTPD